MKKGFLGKGLLFFLCILITMSFSDVSMLAAENETKANSTVNGTNLQVKVIQDNDNMRVAEVYEGKKVTIAKLNKITGEIIIRENNKIVTTVNIRNNINFNSSPITPYVVIGGGGGATEIDSGRDIDSKYKYTVFNTGLWAIKSPAGVKWPMENSLNSGNLHTFRTKVNDMFLKQLEIMGCCGTAALGIITASFVSAPATLGMSAVVALLTAAGCSITAAVMGGQLYYIKKDANYYFKLIN